ncbi:hypothetical protein BDV28DRAFT_140130 [Aspergillus coremiiformis]|uniref:Secreted protein n=1 Tax=Aspergillus coremiiformis TaxID=138285 RepID=A0A5N6Z1S7_9EURO|nr:hypothetical protein BDV28DRAFT_140130 [Aspergillus coremiiformis]
MHGIETLVLLVLQILRSSIHDCSTIVRPRISSNETMIASLDPGFPMMHRRRTTCATWWRRLSSSSSYFFFRLDTTRPMIFRE